MNNEIEWLGQIWNLFEGGKYEQQERALNWLASKVASEKYSYGIAGLRSQLNEAQYDASAKMEKAFIGQPSEQTEPGAR